MDLDTVDDDTLDQLADRLAERLDPGAYGDRVVLSRRQLVGVATGVLGTGTLLSLGVDPAAAQAAGSVGTSSDPVDVNAYDLDVSNGVTSSLAMNGNDITGAGSVSTGSIVVGGTLYEEDDNSPLSATGSQSNTLTLANSSDSVIVIIEEVINRSGAGQQFETRINGDSGTNYKYIDSTATQTTGASAWPINAVSFGDGDGVSGSFVITENVGFGLSYHNDAFAGGREDAVLHGGNNSVNAPVTSITIRGDSGPVDVKARVYRRAMSID